MVQQKSRRPLVAAGRFLIPSCELEEPAGDRVLCPSGRVSLLAGGAAPLRPPADGERGSGGGRVPWRRAGGHPCGPGARRQQRAAARPPGEEGGLQELLLEDLHVLLSLPPPPPPPVQKLIPGQFGWNVLTFLSWFFLNVNTMKLFLIVGLNKICLRKPPVSAEEDEGQARPSSGVSMATRSWWQIRSELLGFRTGTIQFSSLYLVIQLQFITKITSRQFLKVINLIQTFKHSGQINFTFLISSSFISMAPLVQIDLTNCLDSIILASYNLPDIVVHMLRRPSRPAEPSSKTLKEPFSGLIEKVLVLLEDCFIYNMIKCLIICEITELDLFFLISCWKAAC